MKEIPTRTLDSGLIICLAADNTCVDGSTCSRPLPFDEVEPVERTFRDALNDARDALDEAWEKMPTGKAGMINDGLDGWAIQRLLIGSRQKLIYLLDHFGDQL